LSESLERALRLTIFRNLFKDTNFSNFSMYDIIIIGGGPAGLTAAIYAARYKLKALVLTKEPYGTIAEASYVCNYPGFVSISGFEFMQRVEEQAKKLGVIVEYEAASKIEHTNNFKINNTYEGKFLILALGTERRRLNIPGEKEFTGKGISYCFTCDAPLFKDKIVAVAGGADAAAMAALLLREYTKKVYIIYRKEKIRSEPLLVERIEHDTKIEIINNTRIKEVKGDKVMTSVLFDNGRDFKLDGLFVEIGSDPRNKLAKELGVELDNEGFIIVDKTQKTNVDKVFAAGDITINSNKFRQVITACAEGAVAAESIYNSIKKGVMNENKT
jgi:thioredoxin reductase (NADPH)